MGILRTLLAISVVLAHSSDTFGLIGGQIAVQCFFMISGFYMSMILNEKYIGKGSYCLFISNRFLRLFPIYWIIVFCILLLSAFVFFYTNCTKFGPIANGLTNYVDIINSMDISTMVFLFFANIFIFFQDVVMFLGVNLQDGLLFFTTNFRTTEPPLHKFLLVPSAWSLSIELFFYLIAPFIVRKKWYIVFVLFSLSLILRAFLYLGLDLANDPWTYRFFPTELAFFLAGNLAYKIYNTIQYNTRLTMFLPKILFTIIIIFTMFYSFISLEAKMFIYFIIFFCALPFIFILTKKNKLDRYIGELSYPIYICHGFVIYLINVAHIPYIALCVVIFSIIFAIILNELIAKKIEEIRAKRILNYSH